MQLYRDVFRRAVGVFIFDRKKAACFTRCTLERVVLVRWDAKWGDSIVSSFIFREWRKAYPGIKIDVITTPNMSALFKDHFGADHIYEIKKRPSYRELKQLAIEIGETDLLVHLSKALKMKDLYFMNKIKAGVIAGLDDAVDLVNLKLGKESEGLHFSDKFTLLLDNSGVRDIDKSYIIPMVSESQGRVDDFIIDIGSPIVAINPYGSGNARQFNVEKIVKIIDSVFDARKDVHIVLLVAPGKEKEISYIDMKYERVHYYHASKTIYDSISIIRRSDFLISVDTATVHIADGLNKKILAVYNPDEENFSEWGPLNDSAICLFSENKEIASVNNLSDKEIDAGVKKLLA